MKRFLSIVLAALMVLSLTPAFAFAEGEKKYTEIDQPEGWTLVINEDGAELGYSKKSGLKLIEADGYAFKDLDRDGELDVFEDWRVDYKTRARDLAENGGLSVDFQLGLKMCPGGSVGKPNTKELEPITIQALDAGYRLFRFSMSPADALVAWNNMMQEYIESNTDTVVIPVTFEADPLNGNGVSDWPGYLAVAATFDPEVAAEYGRALSKEWRAMNLTMKVAPQVDLATEPRWSRNDMTFGEDPQLSMDMTVAMINAWQSTYDEDGNDLGWGKDSVNCQVKHVIAEGAAEAGRESHSLDGAFNVFPGGQFYTDIMPYMAAQKLPGKTESVSCAMTNYSIALDEYGDPIGGERVASSFNSWKINELWRGVNDWDGYILTDFEVHSKRPYGVEDLTVPERLLKVLTAGVDGWGGFGEDIEVQCGLAKEAYEIGVKELGQEEMDEILVTGTRHILDTLFNVGVVDNPYLSYAVTSTVPNNPENQAAAFEAKLKSIIMLKNNDVIKPAGEEKLTVYIPYKFSPATKTRRGVTPASIGPTMDLRLAAKYFNVVTDKPAAPSGEGGAYTANDIIRASAEDIAACDLTLVRIASPKNANPTASYGPDYSAPVDYEYRPISLQYRPYTADSFYVRFDSIGGMITLEEYEGIYGTEYDYVKENRSYFGKTGLISNEADLDFVLEISEMVDNLVLVMNLHSAMVWSEIEPSVDAILVSFGGGRTHSASDDVLYEIIAGKFEPSALLPMQQPIDMETVEAQFEDVPRDMECYVDTNGNTYDFAFGLNWSGVINDERVAKYNVAPLVGEDPFN